MLIDLKNLENPLKLTAPMAGCISTAGLCKHCLKYEPGLFSCCLLCCLPTKMVPTIQNALRVTSLVRDWYKSFTCFPRPAEHNTRLFRKQHLLCFKSKLITHVSKQLKATTQFSTLQKKVKSHSSITVIIALFFMVTYYLFTQHKCWISACN